MQLLISKLSTAMKDVAVAIDNMGNQNNKIDSKDFDEVSVFKAAFAFMAWQSKALDKEYKSIFGVSAFSEWKQTNNYTNNNVPTYEFTDKKGNVIRGSMESDGINVYYKGKNGHTGYYSEGVVMVPEND